MAPFPPREMLRLQQEAVKTFDNEKWLQLGVLTDSTDIINHHPRLMRSLSFGDTDYSGHVLSVLIAIMSRASENAAIVKSFIDDGLTDVVNISSDPRAGQPKIVFQPSVFSVPEQEIEADLVAVMMPFDAAFDPVYAAIKSACSDSWLKCQRVSDIWEDSTIVQDIFSLIYRSSVVICDFTDRNANVFYEAGIAHTLGRHLVPIAQSAADVPFDLQHHRYLRYLNNREGLAKMSTDLQKRLKALTPDHVMR